MVSQDQSKRSQFILPCFLVMAILFATARPVFAADGLIQPKSRSPYTWVTGDMLGMDRRGRISFTEIWTGTEMLIWGGLLSSPGSEFNTGLRYNPATDTWRPISTANAPAARNGHTAIWTGKEMIVWGGQSLGLSEYFNTGGIYNPATDTWRSISTTNAPEPRSYHTAVWTGSKMIVWGGTRETEGNPYFNTGGIYDPATDSWAPLSIQNAPDPRSNHTAVWTGTQMIVWGGHGAFSDSGYFNTGGIYDPRSDTWTPTSTDQAPEARANQAAVWTGSKMIVWGGDTKQVVGGGCFGNGAVYDPQINTWFPISTTGAPAARTYFSAVWTGAQLLVWGGLKSDQTVTRDGGAYDPQANTWSALPVNDDVLLRAYHQAVWTGTQMLVWGGYDGSQFVQTGEIYDLKTGAWHKMAAATQTGRVYHTAVWTGSEMLVWGGADYSSAVNTGGCYNPATDTWRPISTTNAPEPRMMHTAVWTGKEMLIWGGANTVNETFNNGGRYDPATDTWKLISTTGAPEARGAHTAIWTGSKMIVWGGVNGSNTFFNTGGIYDPATDTWKPISTTGAPEARGAHTAIWTGSKMIVWGGMSGSKTNLNNGAAYDPENDTWSAMTTDNAPEGRMYHTAIWSGSKMIVWGGNSSTSLNTGGIYDPQTNTWSSITTDGAPSARCFHTAVWTGAQMIVWGGSGQQNEPLNSGAAYDPAAGAWAEITTTSAPIPRSNHTAVWTGKNMIVWGGMNNPVFYDNGGTLGIPDVYLPVVVKS